jgi:hypothetical protein
MDREIIVPRKSTRRRRWKDVPLSIAYQVFTITELQDRIFYHYFEPDLARLERISNSLSFCHISQEITTEFKKMAAKLAIIELVCKSFYDFCRRNKHTREIILDCFMMARFRFPAVHCPHRLRYRPGQVQKQKRGREIIDNYERLLEARSNLGRIRL